MFKESLIEEKDKLVKKNDENILVVFFFLCMFSIHFLGYIRFSIIIKNC